MVISLANLLRESSYSALTLVVLMLIFSVMGRLRLVEPVVFGFSPFSK